VGKEGGKEQEEVEEEEGGGEEDTKKIVDPRPPQQASTIQPTALVLYSTSTLQHASLPHTEKREEEEGQDPPQQGAEEHPCKIPWLRHIMHA